MPLFYLTKGNNKMALMKCEECGNDVSTKAQICQKCGAPAPSDADYEAFLQEQKRVRDAKKEEEKAKREQKRAEEAEKEAKKEAAKAKSKAKLAPKRRIQKYAFHWLWISFVLLVVVAPEDQPALLGSLVISWFGAILVVCIPQAIWVAVPLTLLYGIGMYGIGILTYIAEPRKEEDFKHEITLVKDKCRLSKSGTSQQLWLWPGQTVFVLSDNGGELSDYSVVMHGEKIWHVDECWNAAEHERERVAESGDRKVIPMDSFYSCIEQMEIVLSNVGADNRITVVDSSVMKWVKMPTSDGSVNVVCSKPDKNMVITQHQR